MNECQNNYTSYYMVCSKVYIIKWNVDGSPIDKHGMASIGGVFKRL